MNRFDLQRALICAFHCRFPSLCSCQTPAPGWAGWVTPNIPHFSQETPLSSQQGLEFQSRSGSCLVQAASGLFPTGKMPVLGFFSIISHGFFLHGFFSIILVVSLFLNDFLGLNRILPCTNSSPELSLATSHPDQCLSSSCLSEGRLCPSGCRPRHFWGGFSSFN